MDFCPECRGIMLPSDEDLKCTKCGYVKSLTKQDKEEYTIEEKVEAEDNIKMLGDEENTQPTTTEHCPKCGHDKAAYKLLQTRSADEAPTRIFTCLKCKHTWRAYD